MYLQIKLGFVLIPFSWISGENSPRRVVQRGQVRPSVGKARPHDGTTALVDVRVRGVEYIRRQALQPSRARPSQAHGGECSACVLPHLLCFPLKLLVLNFL